VTWDIGNFSAARAKDGTYSVVVVGAGSGIGQAGAEFLATHGAPVACADRNAAAAQATAAKVVSTQGRAIALHLDATNERSICAAMKQVRDSFGLVQALVNCAGIRGRTNIRGREVDLGDFRRSIGSILAPH
jgi:NAD(P)-dependent dehydrogenase (short-subunit alcohol dehydrogenase family)